MARYKRRRAVPEPITLQIRDQAHDGRGVARTEAGKTVFVDNALVGETVVAKILRSKRSLDEAYCVEIITPSPMRVTPRCPYFDACGGCSLQHMAGEQQILFKQEVLRQQLQHFGNIEPEHWLEPIQEQRWGYRTKARLAVKYMAAKGGALVGFREKQSHHIADIERCEILLPQVSALLLPLRELVNTLDGHARLPQIEVAAGDDRTALVFRHLDPLSSDDLQRLVEFARQHVVDLYVQPSVPERVIKLWPADNVMRLHYSLPQFGLEMAFHPLDFTQVNHAINRRMIAGAMKLLEPAENDRILDLFCGLGNFSLPLARKAGQVIGVEGVEAMVQRGAENARRNNLHNVTFFSADLTKDFSNERWASGSFNKILIDPPRSGALKICHSLSKFAATHLLYISCNPATLARDAGVLKEQGYRLHQAGVMDMFPHTGHVESMALFKKDR